MRVLLLLATATLGAQQPAFEVATVKPSSPDERVVGMFVYPGGRMVVTNYNLRSLIHDAYLVEIFQIDGLPKWGAEDRWSITAKPPAGSKSSQVKPNNAKLPPIEEERLMLQSLLAERFKLVVHEEMKEEPVLALTKSGKP